MKRRPPEPKSGTRYSLRDPEDSEITPRETPESLRAKADEIHTTWENLDHIVATLKKHENLLRQQADRFMQHLADDREAHAKINAKHDRHDERINSLEEDAERTSEIEVTELREFRSRFWEKTLAIVIGAFVAATSALVSYWIARR